GYDLRIERAQKKEGGETTRKPSSREAVKTRSTRAAARIRRHPPVRTRGVRWKPNDRAAHPAFGCEQNAHREGTHRRKGWRRCKRASGHARRPGDAARP